MIVAYTGTHDPKAHVTRRHRTVHRVRYQPTQPQWTVPQQQISPEMVDHIVTSLAIGRTSSFRPTWRLHFDNGLSMEDFDKDEQEMILGRIREAITEGYTTGRDLDIDWAIQTID